MNLRMKTYCVVTLLVLGLVLIAASKQLRSTASAAPVADGAILYKQGGSTNVFGVNVKNVSANMPHTNITQDTPDLFAIGYGGNVALVALQGHVHAAAVYTQKNFQGDCETITDYRNEIWIPSNTVGSNIQSIRLNNTCLGATNDTPIVTDVTSVSGSSDVKCPSGYTRREQDLNEGTGGSHVYVCLQFGPASSGKYVRLLGLLGKGSECDGHNTGDVKPGTKASPRYLCVEYPLGQDQQTYRRFPMGDVDFIAQDTPLMMNILGGKPCETKLNHKGVAVEQGSDDLNLLLSRKHIYMCIGRFAE